MSIMKLLDPILEVWLPTKWSRWAVGVTILLATFATRLPEFLPLAGYTLLDQQKLLVQILAPTLICLIGTFIVLNLVVRHSKSLKETHSNEIEELKKTYNKQQDKPEKLTPVVDESFVTQSVVLDGKKFIRCEFDRCSLVFNGSANFGLEHCNFTAPKLIFGDSAGITMFQISKMSGDPAFAKMIEMTINEYKTDKKQDK
ncbi:hypothetical protein M1B72_20820 [Geomonas paludis]|uniref:Uncharacterized protein n=1 Tax=Geomonas paludis TaxID=2740185 RepID=A0A6V8MSC6_9BACT|nr:hypothetical protein [Geomonas paludis]UPU35853.1 hypothetical protein M1B72_20820 [Geomonas paludis]GFO62563.1 hypothetical protein GMPD_04820 [Geomonas paludis]